VAEMNIRSGWIESDFDEKRLILLEGMGKLLFELILLDDFDTTFFKVFELLFD
jgi:hypothetical protein